MSGDIKFINTMDWINKLFLLFLVLSLFNCSDISKEYKNIEHRIVIDSAINVKHKFVVSSKKAIQLETTSESLLGNIQEVVANDDYLFILSSDQIYQFWMNGEFVRVVCKKGRGPQEMIEIRRMVLKNNLLYLFGLGHSMLIFDMDGNLVKAIPTLGRGDFWNFHPNDSETFWVHLYADMKGNNPYYLSLIDSTMTPIDNWQPKSGEGMSLYMQTKNFVEDENNTLYYFHHTSNVVSRLADNESIPEFLFDFGKKTPNYELIATLSTPEEINEKFYNHSKLMEVGFLNDYLFFKYCESKPPFVPIRNFYGIYDIKEHKTYKTDIINGIYPFYNNRVVDNGIVRYQGVLVSQLGEKARSYYEELIGYKLSEDENPFILVDTIYDCIIQPQ